MLDRARTAVETFVVFYYGSWPTPTMTICLGSPGTALFLCYYPGVFMTILKIQSGWEGDKGTAGLMSYGKPQFISVSMLHLHRSNAHKLYGMLALGDFSKADLIEDSRAQFCSPGWGIEPASTNSPCTFLAIPAEISPCSALLLSSLFLIVLFQRCPLNKGRWLQKAG